MERLTCVRRKEWLVTNKIILREKHTVKGKEYLVVPLESNGDLRIDGQDMGVNIEKFWGSGLTDYEYIISVQATDVPSLLKALGSIDEILSAFNEHFNAPDAQGLVSILEETISHMSFGPG